MCQYLNTVNIKSECGTNFFDISMLMAIQFYFISNNILKVSKVTASYELKSLKKFKKV